MMTDNRQIFITLTFELGELIKALIKLNTGVDVPL